MPRLHHIVPLASSTPQDGLPDQEASFVTSLKPFTKMPLRLFERYTLTRCFDVTHFFDVTKWVPA